MCSAYCSLKKACDKMSFDVEMIVVKIYSHFYLFTVRVAKLKKFCESVDVEYKKLIGYSKTRFPGLLSSVDSILRIFDGLKEYFWEIPTPQILCYYFLKIQGPRCGCFSFVIKHLFSTEQLKQWKATILIQWKLGMHSILLSNRSNLGKKKHFCPLQCKRKWNIFLLLTKEEMQDLSRQFYESCIKYIEKWKEQFDHIMIFAWCALDQPPQWKFIETNAKYIATNNHFDMESSDIDLFHQFTYLERYVAEEKIQSGEENGTATDQRWVEIFQHFVKKKVPYNHMVRIISYILSLPGTSATVERVFSLITQIWNDEKSQIKIETLRDHLYVRYNIKMTPKEFFEFLKMQPKMLKEIASNEKYAFKNANQIHENKNKYAKICMQKTSLDIEN